jgi:hypothetical protein
MNNFNYLKIKYNSFLKDDGEKKEEEYKKRLNKNGNFSNRRFFN